MTQRTDIDGVLDLWLADGPPHVPDRVFDDAVAAVYRAPQRSLWRLRWRNLTVSTKLLAAAIAALAVLAVGIGLSAIAPTSDSGATPSPSSVATPTPGAATIGPTLCQPSEPGCTGPLAAGTHLTSSVLSAVRYTVPVGWQKTLDVAGSMSLVSEGQPDAFVAVWPDWQIASQTSCTGAPEPGLGRGVVDLLTFLANHAGLVVAAPEPTVLGGLPGVVLDVRRDDAWNGPCADGVNLFTHSGTINDIGREILEGSRVERLWLLDGPNGHITTVSINAPDDATFDSFAVVAAPIVESFTFEKDIACVDGSACVGPLLPGFHRTLSPLAGAFGYTVPEGWSNSFNTSFGYVLAPVGEEPIPAHGVFVFLDVYAGDQTACAQAPAAGVGHAAADLVGWLGSLPDLSMSEPRQVTVGGLEGFTYDVTATTSGPVCSDGYQLWVSDAPSLWWGMTPGTPERHFVLDRPDGGTVFIIVAAPSTDFESFATGSAGQIVETFDFTP